MGRKLESAILPLTFDNYVFDLYGTLVDIHTDENSSELWEKLALFYGYYGASYSLDALKARYEVLVRQKEQAMMQGGEETARYAHEASPEIRLEEVFEAMFQEKNVAVTPELAVHAGQFFRILSTKKLLLYPGTVELLRQLRREGKRVYLLSNAQRIFTEYEMRFLGLAELFDDILISSDHGVKKPDIRFFEILMNRYGLDPDRTLFVGNDSRTDIGGAKSVGMHTFYVRSSISPAHDSGESADDYVPDFTAWEQAQ